MVRYFRYGFGVDGFLEYKFETLEEALNNAYMRRETEHRWYKTDVVYVCEYIGVNRTDRSWLSEIKEYRLIRD